MNPATIDSSQYFQWNELAPLWDGDNFGRAHAWLGARWNHMIQTRPLGLDDPDARFMQGLAFAAMAIYFTRNSNQQGARLVLEDALERLPEYEPAYRGVQVTPICEMLSQLKLMVADLPMEADCPVEPSFFRQLRFESVVVNEENQQ